MYQDSNGSLVIDGENELSDGSTVVIRHGSDSTSSLAFTGSRTGASNWTAGQIVAFSGFGSTNNSWLRFACSDEDATESEGYAYLSQLAANTIFGTAENTDLVVGYNAAYEDFDTEVAANAPIYLSSSGAGTFSGNVTASGSLIANTSIISNKTSSDSTASSNNVINFQFDGVSGAQIRANKPSGAAGDVSGTSIQIRTGGITNSNRVVTFSPDLSSNFVGDINTNANITATGTITGSNVTLRMQADDPAAYQTVYTADEDGEQVEEQTYIGTTEDLLDIISDLRARVAALEAG